MEFSSVAAEKPRLCAELLSTFLLEREGERMKRINLFIIVPTSLVSCKGTLKKESLVMSHAGDKPENGLH